MARRKPPEINIRSHIVVPGPKPIEVMEREAYATLAKCLLAHDKRQQEKANTEGKRVG